MSSGDQTTQPEAAAPVTAGPEVSMSPAEDAHIAQATEALRDAAGITSPEQTQLPAQNEGQSQQSAEKALVEKGAKDWKDGHKFIVAVSELLKKINKFTIPNIIKYLGEKLFSFFSKKKTSEDSDESVESKTPNRQMQGAPVPA